MDGIALGVDVVGVIVGMDVVGLVDGVDVGLVDGI